MIKPLLPAGCRFPQFLFVFGLLFLGSTLNAQLSVNLTTTNPSCNGFTNGSITASVDNGDDDDDYSYAWSNGATSATIQGIGAGTYSVTVTDNDDGASGTASATLTTSSGINATASQTDACSSTNVGLTVSGGDGMYMYSWSNGATTQNLTNPAPGQYCATVTDGSGCSDVACVTVVAPLEVDVFATILSCANFCDASVTALVSGGTAPYTYLWNTGSTGPVLPNVPLGTYTVTVTDGNGCTTVGSATVTAPDLLEANVTTTNPDCGTGLTGSATVMGSGGVAPYTYAWSTGATTQMITGLSTGSYSVTITDQNGCTATEAFNIISQGDITVSVTGTDSANCDDPSGTATASATGGTGPYMYMWSNGATSASLTNLAAGTYGVTVTDANGCQGSGSVTIGGIGGLNIAIDATPAACGQGGGTAGVMILSGTGPFTYAWSNGMTTAVITGLSAGTYSVTVTDANGCTATASTTIDGGSDITVTGMTFDASCANGDDGSIALTVMGGDTPYSYSWSNGTTGTSVLNGLAAGTYTVTVTDNSGCVTSETFTIGEPSLVTALVSTNSAGCTVANGSASVNASGGTGPYTFAFSGGTASGNSVSGLASGNYTVTITDANNCSSTVNFTIDTSDDNINVNVSTTSQQCDTPGSAVVTANGGTAPYTFNFSTGQSGSSGSVSGLSGGVTYSVTVTDSNGCIAVEMFSVGSDGGNISLAISTTDQLCTTDGSVTVTASGGTAPYTYSFSNGQSGASNSATLAAGSYNVTVTDAQGCTAVEFFDIAGDDGDISITVTTTDQLCTEAGTATVTASGGSGPYTYAFSGGVAAGNTATGLVAGSYTVTVTDANGCTETADFDVDSDGAVLDVTLEVTNPVTSCLFLNAGSITTTVSGGQAPYTYSYTGTSSTASFVNGLTAGTYTVTVTDAQGCSGTATVTIDAVNSISNFVFIDENQDGIQQASEGGKSGVTVTLTGTDTNGGSITMSMMSDGLGNTFFDGLPNGTYEICISAPSGVSITTANAGGDDSVDSDANQTTGCTGTFTLNGSDCRDDIDFGVFSDCDNFTNPGEIGFDQTLCGPGNVPAPLVQVEPATGGSGAITYLWLRTTDSTALNSPALWEGIPNSNSISYSPGVLFETTYFLRCAMRDGCPFVESNVVTISVDGAGAAAFTLPEVACVGETYTFTAQDAGAGAVYTWDFGPFASPNTATGQSVQVMWPSFTVASVELTVNSPGCTSFLAQSLSVTDDPVFCGGGIFNFNIDASATNQGAVEVHWMGRSMHPSEGSYLVERSSDMENWTTLVSMTEQSADGSMETSYSYLDSEPARGVSYYRVSMYAGSEMRGMSNIAEIGNFLGTDNMFVHPNPVTDRVFVDILDTFNADIDAAVIAPDGRVIQTRKIEAGSTRFEFDLDGLPAGVYFLRMNYRTIGVQTYRVIKN